MVAAGSQIPLMTTQRHALQRRREQSACPQLWAILDKVTDPEIPVVSIWELGVLQDIREDEQSGTIVVTITPTYSGCPALAQMQQDIVDTLDAHGLTKVRIETQLAPAWSTDWLTSEARQKLRAYGIATPDAKVCPQCGSANTDVISEFGSTSCKALYRCRDCGEPFDYFKPL